MYQTVVQLLGILASHSCTVCSLLNKVLNLEVCDATGDDPKNRKPGTKNYLLSAVA
jgi:hypothetical protein